MFLPDISGQPPYHRSREHRGTRRQEVNQAAKPGATQAAGVPSKV